MAASDERAAKRLKTGVDQADTEALNPSNVGSRPPGPSDADIWGSDDDDSAHILSDTVAAMILLKREFPKLDKVRTACPLPHAASLLTAAALPPPAAGPSVCHESSTLHRPARPHYG